MFFYIFPYAPNKIAGSIIAIIVEIIKEKINNPIQLKIKHLSLQNPSKQKHIF
jgi:hypothetical protein